MTKEIENPKSSTEREFLRELLEKFVHYMLDSKTVGWFAGAESEAIDAAIDAFLSEVVNGRSD